MNFLGGDEDPGRIRNSFGDAFYDRLDDVMTAYDPDNVFYHNQTIRPRSRAAVGDAARAGGGRSV